MRIDRDIDDVVIMPLLRQLCCGGPVETLKRPIARLRGIELEDDEMHFTTSWPHMESNDSCSVHNA